MRNLVREGDDSVFAIYSHGEVRMCDCVVQYLFRLWVNLTHLQYVPFY